MTAGGDLTHLTPAGEARMVDVGGKPATRRRAVASARISMSARAAAQVRAGDLKKGDALGAARIAGIMAAKRTSDLIPLCHPLALSHVGVEIEPFDTGFVVRATVETTGPTGVEMEALTAASVAALTIYDMAKALDRLMVIDALRLEEKSGGRSGDFVREV
ncbi:MAG TPA: cyclic pyranopterin monophosphate synthase MoaC [Devosiaceae bacterium]|nr:cyclic pyranopterin monophosphate synthase MoaC [Devosiaceae bacterium]